MLVALSIRAQLDEHLSGVLRLGGGKDDFPFLRQSGFDVFRRHRLRRPDISARDVERARFGLMRSPAIQTNPLGTWFGNEVERNTSPQISGRTDQAPRKPGKMRGTSSGA